MACESFKLVDKNDNEISLADYGLYIGSIGGGIPNENFLPDQENIVVDGIINLDGAIFQSQKLKPRPLNIPVFFEDKTEYEINQIKQKFYCKTSKKLIWDRHPYKYIWIVNNGKIDLNYIWRAEDKFDGFFEIPYIAYDPLYYSLFDSSTLPAYLEDVLSNPNYAQLFYDAGFPYLEDLEAYKYVGVVVDGSLTLNNRGNYESKLLIKLVGDCTDLTITNTTTGKSFDIASMTSETLYIDGVRGQIRDETSLQTDSFDGDFIKLEAGENIITLTSTAINLSELEFIYKYTYL